MMNLFRRKSKDETPSYNIYYYKEEGARPFKKVDFSKNNVYQISNFVLRDFSEWSNIHKELEDISFYFETWVIPTVFNPNKHALDMIKNRYKNEEDALTYLKMLNKMLPENDIITRYVFLIVDKENSEVLINKFKKLSFGLKEIDENEAENITVLQQTDTITN